MTPEQMAIRLLEAYVASVPSLAPASSRFTSSALKDAVDTLLTAHATLQQEKAALEEENSDVHLRANNYEMWCDQQRRRAETAEASLRTEKYAHGHTLRQRDETHARAEQAEREREHEALRYEGMRADRDDWRQRNEQAEAITRRLEEEAVQQQVRNGELCGQIVELGTDNRRLREALERYGHHEYKCEAKEGGPCGCGLDAALTGTPEGQP
jgi:hypothetical protein